MYLGSTIVKILSLKMKIIHLTFKKKYLLKYLRNALKKKRFMEL